jgi:predicted nicotinamide N-methyase
MPETNFRTLCEQLMELAEGKRYDGSAVIAKARAALAQPEPVAPKPVVDYSRVPKIATEAQIRSAAQYLVKKRHCDGDLIPAIEYALARWGTPANNTGGTH